MTEKKSSKKRRVYTTALNRFGHKFNAISGQIDRCLLVTSKQDAMTLEQIASACDCNVMRVRSHIQCLKFGKRNYNFGFAIRVTKDKRAYIIASKADLDYYDKSVIKRKIAVDSFETLENE